jgi:hypothetical protein
MDFSSLGWIGQEPNALYRITGTHHEFQAVLFSEIAAQVFS